MSLIAEEAVPLAGSGMRSLLPPCDANPGELFASPAAPFGEVTPPGFGALSGNHVAPAHADALPPEHGSPGGHDVGANAMADPAAALAQSGGQGHMASPPQVEAKPPIDLGHVGAGAHIPHVHPVGGGHPHRGEPSGVDGSAHNPHADPPDEPAGDPADQERHLAPDERDELDRPDGAHSVSVTQLATVEQDASVIVTGYVGEVEARLHIRQDLVMDQDVDISLAIDGDGRFSVDVGQEVSIEQLVDLDLDIFDVDGVLHVDLFLRDSIEVDQATIIDATIGDGPPGGTVDVNQVATLDQEVDIDIDIEDELEERYAVAVDIDVQQAAVVDQDALVDIAGGNGQLDLDVDATQTAIVEQDTIVRLDFALV